MRSRFELGLAGTLCLVLACTDTDLPLQPGGSPHPPAAPELSVVTFGITTIGTPGQSFVNGINELGQVLLSEGPEPFQSSVWTNGGLLELLAPFDAQRVQAFALNGQAMVVGDVDGHAAAWVNGDLTLLQELAGTSGSQAFAVNDLGQIVGNAFLPGNGTPSAVYWESKDAPMTPLQGGLGNAADINNAGVIVGQSLDAQRNFLLGAYWPSPTEAPQFLKGPGTSLCGQASAINNRSEITGFCGVSGAYWPSPQATAISLGGSSGTRDINELGQILGVLQNSGFDFRPVLWHQEGASFRAFDLGVPSGYEEASPSGLNNHGQAVGSALVSFDGQGLMWHIPVRVVMDVVPGTGTSVKLGGGGTVAPTLLGSRWSNAGDIDPASLTLGNDNGAETAIARKRGAPVARFTDVNRDGYLDLVAEFDKQAMARSGDLVVGSQVLIVQGQLRDGTRLRGADQVTGVR